MSARRHIISTRPGGSAFGRVAKACPDCATTGKWHSSPTCPTARAVDAIVEDDAAWFLAHPDATTRRRPTTPGEVAEHLMMGTLVKVTDTCVVTQLAPGIRTRRYEYVVGGGE